MHEYQKPPTHERDLISWRAAEYEFRHKGTSWYYVTAGVTLILAMIAMKQRNFFFAVFIVLAGSILCLFYNRKPDVFDFKITDRGVRIGTDLLLEYRQLESFSIRKREHHLDELILKKKTTVNPYVRIPVDGKLAEMVQEILKQKLPEAEYEENFLDVLSDLIGF